MPENIVLYRRSSQGRFPLFSTDTKDTNAIAKLLARMANEFHNASKSGAPDPDLDVILEATETDKETGKVLSDTQYTLLDPVTLAPKGKSAKSHDGAAANALKGIK